MKLHSISNYKHSVEFLEKRRALFPTDENLNDNDLGHISPLNFDTNSNDEHFRHLINENNKSSIGDYDIIEVVDDNNLKKEKATSICKSPLVDIINKNISETFLSTPSQDSPSQTHQTPHDDNSIINSTCNKIPKLIRKSVLGPALTDNLLNKNQLLTPSQFPQTTNNCGKNSKVRTALFPELSVPTKNFYPKPEHNKIEKVCIKNHFEIKKRTIIRKQRLYLCNRKSRSKNHFGQINAGVKHKIRKRKPLKNLNKSQIIIDEKKSQVMEEKPSNNKTQCDFDDSVIVTEIAAKDEPFLSKTQMDTILKSLDDEKNQICFNGNSAIITNNNNKKDNSNNVSVDVLLSPTSQMCDMTSGLALNSPKKIKNLSTVLEKMPTNTEQQKLFPLFYSDNNKINRSEKRKHPTGNNSVTKRFKHISKNQMLLDAGQKKFGVTQCNECKFVYHIGDPSDEIIHLNYHDAGPALRFHGWKNERIVCDNFGVGRIIQIIPNDPKVWWKKVKDVFEVVNRDLGYFDLKLIYDYCQVFFYIKNKSVVGVLVAEKKSVAHKLLTTSADQVDLCSEECYRIKCGISRIWVSNNNRNQGIATALVNCLKKHFIFGYIMTNDDIAFSSPTEAGKMFGKNYFKTSNFLIYS